MATAPITITASDPITAMVTAIANLGTAWFNYLGTPAGQVFAAQQNAIFGKFNAGVASLFEHAQNQIAAKTPGA